jgi:hypothetical protein
MHQLLRIFSGSSSGSQQALAEAVPAIHGHGAAVGRQDQRRWTIKHLHALYEKSKLDSSGCPLKRLRCQPPKESCI